MDEPRDAQPPAGDYGGPIFRPAPGQGARQADPSAPTTSSPPAARGGWQGYSETIPGEEPPLKRAGQADAPGPRRGVSPVRSSRAPLAIGVVAVLLVVAVFAALALLRGERAASDLPTVSTSAEGPGSEAAALTELETPAASDLESVPRTSQHVAQLASKYVGITDPLQTASNGSHTFLAEDILLEHRALRERLDTVRIVLLRSTAYGTRRTHEGQPYWVTMALSPTFTSSDDVRQWCRESFPDLTGTDLTNSCMVNRLVP